ncbi:MAG TPA: hypothetical protein VKE74_22000 [Gemmataceae bacterium]|nr:hypothetical protein [Gemmataceae bacterium]
MSSLPGLAVRPPDVTDDEQFAGWFARIADRLLNACDFLVNGRAYRFAELEAYYYGPGHPDPFTHRDPVQYLAGRWYFHRTRGEYRGGSFKGVDLALGDGTAMFGMLVRTIVGPDGTVIDGPSLTVDHLLAQTKAADVATLDGMINARPAWDTTSPLAIREAEPSRTATVYHTGRVGLSLKWAKGKPDRPRFVMRPYRYLSEPRAIKKGKAQLVLALHRRGQTADAIHQLTGVPKKTIERYVKDYEAGRAAAGFDAYFGKDLGTAELCKLIGTWAAKFGGPTGG